MSKKNDIPTDLDFVYSFRGKIWKDSMPGGWYFVGLPKGLSRKIRKVHSSSEEGWGRLKTVATIGSTNWRTAIWYDTKAGVYVLPVKALIRKKESLREESRVEVNLVFELEKWLWDKV